MVHFEPCVNPYDWLWYVCFHNIFNLWGESNNFTQTKTSQPNICSHIPPFHAQTPFNVTMPPFFIFDSKLPTHSYTLPWKVNRLKVLASLQAYKSPRIFWTRWLLSCHYRLIKQRYLKTTPPMRDSSNSSLTSHALLFCVGVIYYWNRANMNLHLANSNCNS